MKILKGLNILGIYIAFAILITGLIDFGFEFTTRFELPNIWSILIGLILTIVLVKKTVAMTIRDIEGNKVLLTVNTLSPKKLPGGQTLYNCYYAGFNFVWWWEKDSWTVNLEADIAKAFKFTVSTKDDDVQLVAQYDVEPDPDNLSLYVLNGKDEKDREKNIAMRITTTLQRHIEIFLSYYNSSDIIEDVEITYNGGTKRIAEALHEYLKAVLDQESNELGIRVKKVRIANIDYSKEISEARSNTKAISESIEAAKLISNLSEEDKKSFELVQIIEGKITKKFIQIDAPGNLNKLILNDEGESK